MIRDPERLDRLLAQLRDFVREECIPLEAQIESFVVLGQAFEITHRVRTAMCKLLR